MPGCVAINCANRHEKGFRLFSIPTNVERRKKWLQNLGREQWIPTKSACVCEVHFEDSQFESRRVDGVRKLKPNAVPTLFHVPNSPRRIDSPPRKSPYKKLRSEVPIKIKNNDIISAQQNLNEQDNKPVTSAKCSNCSNYDKLLSENENLKKKIKKLKILQEKKLNWQASVFHTVIRDKEAVLKRKLEIAKNKTKTLNKNTKRKENTLTKLKTLLEFLGSKNISKTAAAFNLSNESDDLSDALLKNIKRNKAKFTYSQHDEHNYACSGEVK
ncbi:uncharacterized protein LOC143900669 [Temnothorax americanus]|uniref:uncharacterized protein LOC143900669 n=1 Tax=Temnothorax americanus TaxID=1964332 RepID=UPI00406911C1